MQDQPVPLYAHPIGSPQLFPELPLIVFRINSSGGGILSDDESRYLHCPKEPDSLRGEQRKKQTNLFTWEKTILTKNSGLFAFLWCREALWRSTTD